MGKLIGGSDFLEAILGRDGVAETFPGKWKMVANSSVLRTNGSQP